MFLLKDKYIKYNCKNIVLFMILYLLNKSVFEKIFTGFIFIFCNSYFSDIIAPIVYLSVIEIIIYFCCNYKLKNYIYILTIGIIAGFVWEYIGPIINPSSTKDVNDLICYIIGTNIFFGLLKFYKNV